LAYRALDLSEVAVLERLDGDPRIADSTEIAVSAKGGVVTPCGTVQSLSPHRAAAEDAIKDPRRL
jgi:hypothetical protein